MKRLIGTVGAAIVYGVLVAAPALADQGNYPPEVEAGGGSHGTDGATQVLSGGGGTGGTDGVAFTGFDVTLSMVIVAALVIVGVTALVLSRRRAAEVRA